VWNDGRTGQNKKKRATTQVNFSTVSSRAFSPFIPEHRLSEAPDQKIAPHRVITKKADYPMLWQFSDPSSKDRRLPAGNSLSTLTGGQELMIKRNSFLF